MKKQAKLIKKEISESVVAIINNNTVVFQFKHLENEVPKSIDFKVYRGENTQDKAPQAIGGSFPYLGAFSIYNVTDREKNDGALTDEIHEYCIAIFNDEINIA